MDLNQTIEHYKNAIDKLKNDAEQAKQHLQINYEYKDTLHVRMTLIDEKIKFNQIHYFEIIAEIQSEVEKLRTALNKEVDSLQTI